MPEETFETTQTIQPAETKSLDWPKIVLAAVLGLGLLTAAAYAGYWYGSESSKFKSQSAKPQLKTQVQPAPDPTANWKTYTNTKFMFTLKYPQDYLFKGEGPNASEKQIEAGEQISGTNPPAYNIATFEKSSQRNFSISVFHKPTLKFDENYIIGGECGSQFAIETLLNQVETIDSLQILVRKQEFASPSDNTTSIGIDYCFLNKDGYLITLRSGSDPTAFTDTDKLLRQILSTFKFLD